MTQISRIRGGGSGICGAGFFAPDKLARWVPKNFLCAVICEICAICGSLLVFSPGSDHVSDEINLGGLVTGCGVETGGDLAIAHHQDGMT
jgi:hypothetical protein